MKQRKEHETGKNRTRKASQFVVFREEHGPKTVWIFGNESEEGT